MSKNFWFKNLRATVISSSLAGTCRAKTSEGFVSRSARMRRRSKLRHGGSSGAAMILRAPQESECTEQPRRCSSDEAEFSDDAELTV